MGVVGPVPQAHVPVPPANTLSVYVTLMVHDGWFNPGPERRSVTYEIDGKQYVAIAAGNTLVAFSLPDE